MLYQQHQEQKGRPNKDLEQQGQGNIFIQAAKNETESFQVVLFPQKSIKDIFTLRFL